MSQHWQAATQAAVSTDRNALNWLPTDAHLRNTIANIQVRYPIRPLLHPMLEQQAQKLTLHADRRREAATRKRNCYRSVLNNYVNALPALRDRATQVIGYMTMIIQNADWLDATAEKLENAARSPTPAADIWETLTWTSDFFP